MWAIIQIPIQHTDNNRQHSTFYFNLWHSHNSICVKEGAECPSNGKIKQQLGKREQIKKKEENQRERNGEKRQKSGRLFHLVPASRYRLVGHAIESVFFFSSSFFFFFFNKQVPAALIKCVCISMGTEFLNLILVIPVAMAMDLSPPEVWQKASSSICLTM